MEVAFIPRPPTSSLGETNLQKGNGIKRSHSFSKIRPGLASFLTLSRELSPKTNAS